MKADRKKIEHLLKIAKGQIDGILNMIANDAYCIDVSNQVMATEAILKRVNRDILSAHLNHCVAESFTQDDSDAKLKEIMSVIDQLIK